ncbi:hypothetical protein QVD17_17158 [Tagetes erecta]|uniref:Uncharacterized protein n=1 Tax=Tagetes erecta TaxID=13708 RepID=A0AAD8NU30_TARER|nr:hypothetical protein QVD17_17158 [Tagetes erecta]
MGHVFKFQIKSNKSRIFTFFFPLIPISIPPISPFISATSSGAGDLNLHLKTSSSSSSTSVQTPTSHLIHQIHLFFVQFKSRC